MCFEFEFPGEASEPCLVQGHLQNHWCKLPFAQLLGGSSYTVVIATSCQPFQEWMLWPQDGVFLHGGPTIPLQDAAQVAQKFRILVLSFERSVDGFAFGPHQLHG